MFEYEYRLHVGLDSFRDMHQILLSISPNIKTLTVKFAKHFCLKKDVWEIKKKLNTYAVYYLSQWFKFVESEEKTFSVWTANEHKSFYKLISFYQYPLTIEHRYQIDLSKKSKIYGYVKNGTQFGLVFELEVKCSREKIKKLPIDLKKLKKYRNILHVFKKGYILPYELGRCERKRVYHTLKPIQNAYAAIKHDGIFGLVYSYDNYIYEMWEGNEFKLIKNKTLGNGFVFAAEKLNDNEIILLDVYQVRGYKVLHLESVFFDFLPNLALPPHYKVQTYFKDYKKLETSDKSDGIIFHTKRDKIFKFKPIKTIDLLYENGYFLVNDLKIPTSERLINGVVYECNSNFKVIKERPDRFISNTLKQINEVVPL